MVINTKLKIIRNQSTNIFNKLVRQKQTASAHLCVGIAWFIDLLERTLF